MAGRPLRVTRSWQKIIGSRINVVCIIGTEITKLNGYTVDDIDIANNTVFLSKPNFPDEILQNCIKRYTVVGKPDKPPEVI
jgi:hypothetical protein